MAFGCERRRTRSACTAVSPLSKLVRFPTLVPRHVYLCCTPASVASHFNRKVRLLRSWILLKMTHDFCVRLFGGGLLFSSRYKGRVCFTETDGAPSGWDKPPTCQFAFVPGVTEGVGANLSPPFAPLRRISPPPPPLPNLGHPVFI